MAGIGDVLNKLNDVARTVNSLPSDIHDVFQHVEDVYQKVIHLPQDISNIVDDIGTALHNLEQIIDTDLPNLLTKVKDLPDKLDHVITIELPQIFQAAQDALSKVVTLAQFLGADGQGGTQFRNLLESFFGSCGNILRNPVGLLLADEAFVKQTLGTLARVLAEAAPPITDAMVSALAGVEAELGDTFLRVARKIATILESVLVKTVDGLCTSLVNVSDFPTAIQNGPRNASLAVQDLFNVLRALPDSNSLNGRADAVGNSITQLLSIVGGVSNIPVLGQGVLTVVNFIKSLSSGNVDGTLNSFLKGIVFPKEVISSLFESAANGSLWKWAQFPSGFDAGGLAKWINDNNTYSDPTNPSLLERVYRLRMVAVADAYLREVFSATSVTSSLTNADRRLSPALLADIITAFLDTTILFVLEPNGLLQPDNEIDNLEDLGREFASCLGRQIRSTIRAALGTLFRGFWVFSVQNEALIELVASAISGIFASIWEGVVRNITWSFRVLSRYSNDGSGGFRPSLVVNSLDFAGSIQLQYIAVVRNDPFGNAISIGPKISGLLSDYAAYLDMCYSQYLIMNRFRSIPNLSQLSILQVTSNARHVSVKFRPTPRSTSVPIPVARAYLLSQVVPMQCNSQTGEYTAELDLPFPLPAKFKVACLTSEGVNKSVTV